MTTTRDRASNHSQHDAGGSTASRTTETHFLHELISTVGSSLDLEEVLAAVVRLLSDASTAHACFVYLLDRDERRLTLRAASEPYSGHVGEIELARGEGLAWWVLERGEAAFIRDNALADPRVKYVQELNEEQFQSLVAVPLIGKGGAPIGVITLDTEAPREFSDGEVNFLVASASLVAGALDNARLHDETRHRLSELEQLQDLSEVLATADTAEQLGAEVVDRARKLLRADGVALYLLDYAHDRLELISRCPNGLEVPHRMGLTGLGSGLGRAGSRVTASLVVDGELVGALVAHGARERDLVRAVASQTAVAIKKIQVLERLTEKNLIRDFFDDLAVGRASAVGRAARLGSDLGHPHIVLVADHADEELEQAIARTTHRSLVDRRDQLVRAILPVPTSEVDELLTELRRIRNKHTTIGVSGACTGLAALKNGFEEARHALVGASLVGSGPCVLAYEELGPYKYVLRIALDPETRDETIDAVFKLAAYDVERSTSLLETLEAYLQRRGNISSTSEALYVHSNTLRQRLRRIADLTGLDLRRDDWLTIEIAIKLVRVRQVLQRMPQT